MKNKKKNSFLLLFLILLLAGFFGFYSGCLADSPPVIINELMWMGSSISTADEWVELKNLTSSLINFSITPWSIYKNDSLTLVINSGILEADGYFLISNNDKDHIFTGGESILNVTPDFINSSVSLSNSSAQYKLYDAKDNSGNLIDTADDGSGTPLAGENSDINKSMERKDNCYDGTDKNCWQTCFEAVNLDAGILDLATPKAENSKEIIIPPPVYSHDIRINELLPNPSESPEKEYEYVELYNFGKDLIDLENWTIRDKSRSHFLSGVIEPEGYAFFYDTVSLNNDGDEIGFYDPNGGKVSRVSYKEADEDKSYSRKEEKWKWTSFKTPGAENKFDEDVEYPEGVIINEVLPNPSGDEEKKEYIELHNTSKEKIDISGWTLKDATKSGKYVFPEETFIKSREFFAVYRKIFDFALNNSGDETVTLSSPNGKKSSSVSYDGAKENVSYNFTGSRWRWSKFLTPGKKNKFNNLPEVRLKFDKDIFLDIYASFSVKVKDPDKDEIKVTWDFGDGHKSYLKETRHKYEKKGKYNVSVKVFDGSEEVVRKFTVEVKDFPKSEVKIIALSPNPKGNDTELEWILLENKEDEEVNLKGWSVATGWDNLYNHPIYDDFEIGAGKTKILTRDLCKFTLNNKQAKIELRYPTGDVADEVKYDKKDESVQDDEVYKKTEDGWIWIKPQNNTEEEWKNAEILENEAEEIIRDNFFEFIGGQSLNLSRENYLAKLLIYGTDVKLSDYLLNGRPRVLGASVVKENGNNYIFSGEGYSEDHWAVKFLKNIFGAINYLINKLITGIF